MNRDNQIATSPLVVWDYIPIVAYFLLVLAVGLGTLWRSNRGTMTGYFLAGRYMTWLPVGASLFASNIGSEHFIGLAGSGAAGGIGTGAFNINSCVLIQLLGWVFLPVYIASGVFTLPEYIKKRYGGQRLRVYLAVVSLILYIFTKISVNLYSGTLFLQQVVDWNMYAAVAVLLAVTCVCMVTGGLAAVIYTDTLQFFIMLGGAAILMVKSFIKVGGYAELKVKYMAAIPNETLYSNSTCGIPRSDSWQMLRDPLHSDMPWAGFLFGQTTSTIWYWCADQMIVQRALSAKSLSHAQGGCLMAGYTKFLPFFLMVLPGMISRVLYTDEVACASAQTCLAACGNAAGCTNSAYPKLVMGVLPVGLRGLMLAAMLAALMSDLTSIFNSTSTLFTMDIWKYYRTKYSKKAPTVRELMIVGRLAVIVLVGISIVWIPIIQGMQGAQLMIYKVEIAAMMAPPIAAVYLIAILWKRGNEKGCFCGLVAGFIVGITKMILNLMYPSGACWEEDTRPPYIGRVHYMYFAMILFWITVVVDVVVSLLTEPPDDEKLIRTTWWTRFSEEPRSDDAYADADADAEEYVKGSEDDIELNDNHIVVTREAKLPDVNRSKLRRGNDWLCGYDDTFAGRVKARKYKAHLKEVESLKQDRTAKIFLNTNLVLICVLTAVFLIVFSIPGLI